MGNEMTTNEQLLTLHRAIMPAYDVIRKMLPSLIDYQNDTYPDEARQIRVIAAIYMLHQPNLAYIDLNYLAEQIEAVLEMG